MSPTKNPPLKILLLHGYTQSPTLFLHKSRALQKHLQKRLPSYQLSFSCPCAPHRLIPADIPGFLSCTSISTAEHGNAAAEEVEDADTWGWWRRKDTNEGEIVYEGLEEGLRVIGRCMRDEGPFDGVIGFSQGGCAAGIIAALLKRLSGERGDERNNMRGYMNAFRDGLRGWEGATMDSKTSTSLTGSIDSADLTNSTSPTNATDLKDAMNSATTDSGNDASIDAAKFPPLKFAIIYSGFKAPGKRHQSIYDPRIQTPTLHFLGSLDSVVEESRSRALIDACANAEVVVHPGGHFLPSQRVWMDACLGFIKRCLENGGEHGKDAMNGVDMEKVEDMDLPF